MRKVWILFACLTFDLTFMGPREARAEWQEVFQIGKSDQSFAEFARARKPGAPVVYHVGTSSPSQDWYTYQPGTFDYEVGRSSRAEDWTVMHPGPQADLKNGSGPVRFEVDFDLPSTPRGEFLLHLGAILMYGRPAAPRYEIEINGRTGA